MDIKKATGRHEAFSHAKLSASLRRAGVPGHQVEQVSSAIERGLEPGITSTDIFRSALRHLVKEDLDTAVSYGLRRAVNSLGPEGFIFEQYVEALLRAYGYKTERNVIMQGMCVDHEIDVLAKKDHIHYLIEAKYRNSPGIKTHIDVVMYADARRNDIAPYQEKNEKEKARHIMWLITNTKFTRKSIQYAECRDLLLTGWNYPKEDNLQDLIRKKKAYPVTVLPSLSRAGRKVFVEKGMLLAQDILPYTEEQIQGFGLSVQEARSIYREVHELLKK
ncbi:hypothetical protein COB55_01095 [Candidatus Wolfebacteria bacterium]|nr:MAG: hypothetical protein COB55_01095 [Candidatus Wolfebacteria bacterium]